MERRGTGEVQHTRGLALQPWRNRCSSVAENKSRDIIYKGEIKTGRSWDERCRTNTNANKNVQCKKEIQYKTNAQHKKPVPKSYATAAQSPTQWAAPPNHDCFKWSHFIIKTHASSKHIANKKQKVKWAVTHLLATKFLMATQAARTTRSFSRGAMRHLGA